MAAFKAILLSFEPFVIPLEPFVFKCFILLNTKGTGYYTNGHKGLHETQRTIKRQGFQF